MSFIKDLLSKISCHHEWQVHTETSTYEYAHSKRPCIVEQILICKKCGKIKRIRL
jgi:Fe2+ or Zn2+ uptake regulation protein